jgi:hypothetical protein
MHLPDLQIVYATGSPEMFRGHTLAIWEKAFFKPFDPFALVAAVSALSKMGRPQCPASAERSEARPSIPALASIN